MIIVAAITASLDFEEKQVKQFVASILIISIMSAILAFIQKYNRYWYVSGLVEQIYHEWILAKRPAASKYVWEHTKAKLTANKLFVEAKVFLRRPLSVICEKLSSTVYGPYDQR